MNDLVAAQRPVEPRPFSTRLLAGFGRRFGCVLVVVFILMAPYIANLTRDYTRYLYFWRDRDTFTLAGALLIVSLPIVMMGELLRWTRHTVLIRLAKTLFVAGLGVGLLANGWFAAGKLAGLKLRPGGIELQAAWIVLALLVAAGYGRDRLFRFCCQLCQIFLPVIPLTLGSLAFSSTYPEPRDALPEPTWPCAASVEASAATPIYVLLFDEWSYERTFENGAVLTRFPHLAEFARTATVYHDAHSPAGFTEGSIPGILLQTDLPVSVHDENLGFRKDDTFIPASRLQSVFKRLQPSGYRSVLIGSALPYRMWLGDQVDACRTSCYYAQADDNLSQIEMHLFRALRYSPDLWLYPRYKQWEKSVVCSYVAGCHHEQQADICRVISNWPARTFLFAHLMLPHSPTVLNADLSVRPVEHCMIDWNPTRSNGYELNLQAMDGMMGRLLDEMRRAGRCDDALIILTSDHTWRSDPRGVPPARRTHVPLLVKAPRQNRTQSIQDRFETRNLGALIESMVAGPAVLPVTTASLVNSSQGQGEP